MRDNLRGDIFGGLTAGVVALPLALAFGVQSGMGAAAGIYGAILVGFFASLLGGTPAQVSGPTGPMTVISALVIGTAVSKFGSLDAALPMILATFFLAGVVQLIFSFSRIGQYIRYMPYPVVSGFMTGIGIIIILMQLFPFLGHMSPKRVFDIVLVLHEPLTDINYYTVAITLLTVVTIYILPRFTKAVPSSLVALVVITTITAMMKIPVPLIGDIPHGFPALRLNTILSFSWSDIGLIIIPAITLAALSSIDSLLTSVIADNITKTKHNSNKELFGQSIGNMIAALFGGLPGAGATMRTVVNVNAGGRTKFAGMLHSVLLLAVLMGLGRLASLVPLSVLAGILITVGISIIDYKGLRHLMHVPKAEAFIMLTVIVMTVFVDLLQAVAVGMVLASVLFMKKMGDVVEEKTRVISIGELQKEVAWDDEKLIPESAREQVYIKHLNGPLFFGFTSQFQSMILSIPTVKYVIIRMKHVPYMDQTGLYAIEEAVMYLQSKNVKVLLTGLQEQPRDMMERINLIPGLIAKEHTFTNFKACVSWLKTELGNTND